MVFEKFKNECACMLPFMFRKCLKTVIFPTLTLEFFENIFAKIVYLLHFGINLLHKF